MLVTIPDPEVIWKAEQEEIKKQQVSQQQEEEVSIIIDTARDQSLKQDFVPFPSDDDDDSNMSMSDRSGVYNSDNDYSWVRRGWGI